MAKRATGSTKTQKDKLELEKLQLEVAQLRRPTRSALWCITWKDIVTVLVAIIGIFLVYWNGLFDGQQKYLQAGNERLHTEKIQLEMGNKELEQTRSRIQQENKHLEKELEITKVKLGDHEKELAAIWKLNKGFVDAHMIIEVKLHCNDERIAYVIEISPFNWGSNEYLGNGEPVREIRPCINEIIKTVADIRNLQSLRIQNIELSKEDIALIAKLNVDGLHLDNCNLTDEMVEPIGNMGKLISLKLSGNKGIQHPRIFQRLHHLDFLNVAETSFDDEGMAFLRHLSKTLMYLFLDSTDISDSGLLHLKDFTKLRYLSLNYNSGITSGTALVNLIEIADLGNLSFEHCGMEEKVFNDLVALLEKKSPLSTINNRVTPPKLRTKMTYKALPIAPSVKKINDSTTPPKPKAQTK